MDEFTIQVRIDEPRKESSNFFVVFLDPLLMKKMNLKKGNFVSLIGEKKDCCNCTYWQI